MIARFAIPFFVLMGVIVAPLLVALLCRIFLPRRFRKWAIIACTLLIWGILAYGHFVSFEELEIRQIEYASSDLPASFEGYRIVHFSDAHLGTLTGRRQWMVQRMVDSINALRPDVIVFTGDLQNIYPDELPPHIPVLRQLHAKDGVFSVLGNHDYDIYQSCDDAQKEKNCQLTIEAERKAGWQLLLNEHRWLYRGGDRRIGEWPSACPVLEMSDRHWKVSQTRHLSSCCSTTRRVGVNRYCLNVRHS